MAEQSTPRGGRRKEESRRKILDAARLLFVGRGYHHTRPQDIAREAGVGHGTFYLHFPDKKACFLAFVEEARDEVTQASIARIEGVADLPGQIRGIFEAIFDYGAAHPGVLNAALTDAGLLAASDEETPPPTVLEQWGDVWADRIKIHQAAGTVPKDVDANLAGQAIVGMIRQVSMVAQRRGVTRDQMTNFLVRFALNAVGG